MSHTGRMRHLLDPISQAEQNQKWHVGLQTWNRLQPRPERTMQRRKGAKTQPPSVILKFPGLANQSNSASTHCRRPRGSLRWELAHNNLFSLEFLLKFWMGHRTGPKKFHAGSLPGPVTRSYVNKKDAFTPALMAVRNSTVAGDLPWMKHNISWSSE